MVAELRVTLWLEGLAPLLLGQSLCLQVQTAPKRFSKWPVSKCRSEPAATRTDRSKGSQSARLKL